MKRILPSPVSIGLVLLFLCAPVLLPLGCLGTTESRSGQTIPPGWYGPLHSQAKTSGTWYSGYNCFLSDGHFQYLELGFRKTAGTTVLFQATWMKGTWRAWGDTFLISLEAKGESYSPDGLGKGWQQEIVFTTLKPQVPRPLNFRLAGDTMIAFNKPAAYFDSTIKTELPAGVKFDPARVSENLVKQAIPEFPEDSAAVLDLDKVAYPDSSNLPHHYEILDSGGIPLVLDRNLLTLQPKRDFYGDLQIIVKATGSDGKGRTDSLRIRFFNVNDLPILVEAQTDTAIHFAAELTLPWRRHFRDPDDFWLKGAFVGDTSRITAVFSDSLVTLKGKGKFGPVPIRIVAKDAIGAGDTLAFTLNTNGPATPGIPLGLPIWSDDDMAPNILLERSERKTMAIFTIDKIYFVDSHGALIGPTIPVPKAKPIVDFGFDRNRIFFDAVYGSQVDTMAWLQVDPSTPLLAKRAFITYPSSLQSGGNSFVPVRTSFDTRVLFTHRSTKYDSGKAYGVYSIAAATSGGAFQELCVLPVPRAATIRKVVETEAGYLVFWYLTSDGLEAMTVTAGAFSKEGNPIGVPAVLSPYTPGTVTVPGFKRCHKMLLDAFVLDGRIEVLHSTANGTEAGFGGKFSDAYIMRTAFEKDLFTSSAPEVILPGTVKPGDYAGVYPLHLGLLGGSRYRIYWGLWADVSDNPTIGAVTVDAASKTYSEPAETPPGKTVMDFQFADGTVFRDSYETRAGGYLP